MKSTTSLTLAAPAAPATAPAAASTPTLDLFLKVHVACANDSLGGPLVWALRGWADRLRTTNAPQHAANSFAKHRREFGALAEVARALTVARCVDFGLDPEDAATLVRARIAARLDRES